jgi:general secretion pathway protein K
VAVVTALLLTTLMITAVIDLFWQQQVQVRSVENQRLQLKTKWVMRGVIDWAELILSEDARYSRTDTLDEPWAVPLTATRVDTFEEDTPRDADDANIIISGNIVDAQSRYNLTNMSVSGAINRSEVKVFERLLSSLHLNPALAQATAILMAASQRKTANGASKSDSSIPKPLRHVDDLLAVPGFTRDAVAKLRDFVILLPRATPVNANTASAEVLAARINNLTVQDANKLITTRNTASFRDVADISLRLSGEIGKLPNREISVASNYFLVECKVRMHQGRLEGQALIERSSTNTKIIWIRNI